MSCQCNDCTLIRELEAEVERLTERLLKADSLVEQSCALLAESNRLLFSRPVLPWKKLAKRTRLRAHHWYMMFMQKDP